MLNTRLCILILCFLFNGSYGFSEENPKDNAITYKVLTEYLNVINYNLNVKNKVCSIDNDEQSKCKKKYSEFYENNVINIKVFLGYIDHENTVLDSFYKAAMIDKLRLPCVDNPKIQICGFETTDDANVLSKVIVIDGVPKTIKITIKNPSLSSNGSINQNQAKQKSNSIKIENEFYKSMSNADALFYVGHSRVGWGFDFSPPKIKDGHVDYGFYQSKVNINQNCNDSDLTGMNRFVCEMKKIKAKKAKLPKVFGAISCSSNKYFLNKIRSIDNEIGFIGSNETTPFLPMFGSVLGGINSILVRDCGQDFNQGLTTIFISSGNNYYYSLDGFVNQ